MFNTLSGKVPRPNKFRGHSNGFYFGFVNLGKPIIPSMVGNDFHGIGLGKFVSRCTSTLPSLVLG